jgi:hypothetical protein
MEALQTAADEILDVMLRTVSRGIVPTSVEVIETMWAMLVEELGCSERQARDAVRGALVRRALSQGSREAKAKAREVMNFGVKR